MHLIRQAFGYFGLLVWRTTRMCISMSMFMSPCRWLCMLWAAELRWWWCKTGLSLSALVPRAFERCPTRTYRGTSTRPRPGIPGTMAIGIWYHVWHVSDAHAHAALFAIAMANSTQYAQNSLFALPCEASLSSVASHVFTAIQRGALVQLHRCTGVSGRYLAPWHLPAESSTWGHGCLVYCIILYI